METRYYTAQTILKEALCNNCGKTLKYVKSDFSRKDFCWLHRCEKCNKKYWLNDRYPLVDYLVDLNTPQLQLPTDPIPFEEGTEKMIGVYKITKDGPKLVYKTDDAKRAADYKAALETIDQESEYTCRIIEGKE